jgi:hypothetical protein
MLLPRGVMAMQAMSGSVFARASRSPILLLSALVVLALDGLTPGLAADEAWPVEHKLVGKKDKHSTDVSGIACMPGNLPRKCLVIDDEVQFAQFVIVKDGGLIAGDTIALVDSDDTPWSIDGEGVTFAPGGAGKPDIFYIIGSHGHPRDRDGKLDALADAGEIKARYDASSVLVRLPVTSSTIDDKARIDKKVKGATLTDLRPMIYLEPALAPLRPFLGKRLEEKPRGLNFEGIAAVDGRLYVGLRAPTLRRPLARHAGVPRRAGGHLLVRPRRALRRQAGQRQARPAGAGREARHPRPCSARHFDPDPRGTGLRTQHRSGAGQEG